MALRSLVCGLLLPVVLAGASGAEPMQLDDPRPRWIDVQFEVSSGAHPGRLDAVYSQRFRARLEPGPGPRQVTVTVDGGVVERYLLADQNPKPGSFGDFVWVFDTATGRVQSARLSGTLIRKLDWGLFTSEAETKIYAEMTTEAVAGFEKPRRLLGQVLFRYCSDRDDESCTLVAPEVYDGQTGYVNAVGALRARSGIITTRTFSPLGEARFSERHLPVVGPTRTVSAVRQKVHMGLVPGDTHTALP